MLNVWNHIITVENETFTIWIGMLSCSLHESPDIIPYTSFPQMSTRIQGVFVGAFVGGAAYLYTYKDVSSLNLHIIPHLNIALVFHSFLFHLYMPFFPQFWTAYESVAQEISKIHYTTNPNVIPLPKKGRNEPTTWLVGYKEESREAQGRTPSEAYNGRVRALFKVLAEKLY